MISFNRTHKQRKMAMIQMLMLLIEETHRTCFSILPAS